MNFPEINPLKMDIIINAKFAKTRLIRHIVKLKRRNKMLANI